MKSVAYKGVEYECHIIDTAGQVSLLIHIFSFSSFFFTIPDTCDFTFVWRTLQPGWIHADKQSICYWDTRLYTCVLHNIKKFLQHDTRCIRQDPRLLWPAQNRLRHSRFQKWFKHVVRNFRVSTFRVCFWPYLLGVKSIRLTVKDWPRRMIARG